MIIVLSLLGWWGSNVMDKKGRSGLVGFLLGFLLGILGIVICFMHTNKNEDMYHYLDNLKRLEDLRKSGTITQTEYEEHKKELDRSW